MKTKAERLRWAQGKAGFRTMRQAAIINNWNEATYRAHVSGGRRFKYDTAVKYATAFHINPQWLWTGKGDPKPDMENSATVESVPITGEVAAGHWLEVAAADEFHSKMMAPFDPRYPPNAQFGLFVRGNSANRIAKDGEILVCLDLQKHESAIRDQDAVVIERRRARDGLIELTARRVRKIDETIEFTADSDDSRYQPPLKLPKNHPQQDNEAIVIRALILGAYRPLRTR